MPRSFYFLAVALYAVIGLSFVLQYLVASNTRVTDATGAVWQTGDIYETAAIVSIYSMIFVAVVTAVKLFQGTPGRPRDLVDDRLLGSREGVSERAS